MTTTSHGTAESPTHECPLARGGFVRGLVGVAVGLSFWGSLGLTVPAPAASATPLPVPVESAGSGVTDRDVTPATALVGLVRPEAARVSGTTAPAVLSPATRSRLASEAQARRAASRAVAGARAGHSRPVEGTRLSSPFGTRWGRLHAGVDFAGPIGQAVRAVASGTVTVAGPAQGYGRLVEIRHEDGSSSRYGHLHRVDVKAGDRVHPAQVLGALGNAGRSTGPHLHLEIRTPQGRPVDPMPWLQRYRIVPIETPAH